MRPAEEFKIVACECGNPIINRVPACPACGYGEVFAFVTPENREKVQATLDAMNEVRRAVNGYFKAKM